MSINMDEDCLHGPRQRKLVFSLLFVQDDQTGMFVHETTGQTAKEYAEEHKLDVGGFAQAYTGWWIFKSYLPWGAQSFIRLLDN